MGNSASSEEGGGSSPASGRQGESPPNGARSASASDSIDTDRDISLSEQQQDMGYWQMAKVMYGELVNAIIRPPRAEYDLEDLGPRIFKFCGKTFQRTDFRLINDRRMQHDFYP